MIPNIVFTQYEHSAHLSQSTKINKSMVHNITDKKASLNNITKQIITEDDP